MRTRHFEGTAAGRDDDRRWRRLGDDAEFAYAANFNPRLRLGWRPAVRLVPPAPQSAAAGGAGEVEAEVDDALVLASAGRHGVVAFEIAAGEMQRHDSPVARLIRRYRSCRQSSNSHVSPR